MLRRSHFLLFVGVSTGGTEALSFMQVQGAFTSDKELKAFTWGSSASWLPEWPV